MLSNWKHFDIHTESPDWKFVAILNGISAFGLGVIVLLSLSQIVTTSPWLLVGLYALLPFSLVGIAGLFHFLVTVPLMRRFFPRNTP